MNAAAITRIVLRFRTPILIVWLAALAAAASTYVARFSIDNSVGIWFLEDDPDLTHYRDFTASFGDREWIVAVVRTESIRSPGFHAELAALAHEITALPEIERALSIADTRILDTPLGALLVRSGDDRHTAMLIESGDRTGAGPVSWTGTVDSIRAVLERGLSLEEYWLVGNPVINAELNRAARRDMFVFYAVIAGLLGTFGLVFLGNWRDTLVMAGVVAGAILPPLAAVGLSGASFNMITLMLPTILVAMSSSLAIHAINEFHLASADRPTGVAIEAAVAAISRPAFWTSVTTCIGFLALAQSQVAPIRQVGYLAAFGVACGYATAMLIAPVLLGLLWRDGALRKVGQQSRTTNVIEGLLSYRGRPRLTIAFAVVLFGTCLAGLPRLEADTDYVDFFREGRQMNRDYSAVAATGFPQDVVRLGLTFPHPPHPSAVARLTTEIERMPAVDTVVPVAADGTPQRVHLAIFMEHLSSNALADFEKRVLEFVPEGVDGRLTGTRVLWANMDRSVLATQLRSVGLVLALLVILMPLLTGSIRAGLAGLAASALPVFAVLGLMGWAGLTVNVATCLIGGVALGVAVDDTIFFIVRARYYRTEGFEARAAIAQAKSTVGRAMVLTTLIMSLCFLTMGLSDFVPTAQFGLLFSAVLALALMADLILLPNLLIRCLGVQAKSSSRVDDTAEEPVESSASGKVNPTVAGGEHRAQL